MTEMSGAILAGGKSTRFGRDKSALVYQGESFLARMRKVLISAGLTQIYISHPEHIADIHTGLGPLSGIYSVLKACSDRGGHVVFVPVDMPNVTAEMLCELMQAAPNYDLVRYEDHHMPLRLANTLQMRNLLEKTLCDASNLSLGYFFDQVETHHILTHHHHAQKAFSNINTPAAFNALS